MVRSRWYVSGAASLVARPASPLPFAATSAGHHAAAVTTRLHIKRCACCSTRHRQRHPESPRAASAPSGSGRFTAPIAGWTPPRLASSSPRRSSLASVSGTPSAWTPWPRPRSFRSRAWTWRPQAAPRIPPCGSRTATGATSCASSKCAQSGPPEFGAHDALWSVSSREGRDASQLSGQRLRNDSPTSTPASDAGQETDTRVLARSGPGAPQHAGQSGARAMARTAGSVAPGAQSARRGRRGELEVALPGVRQRLRPNILFSESSPL